MKESKDKWEKFEEWPNIKLACWPMEVEYCEAYEIKLIHLLDPKYNINYEKILMKYDITLRKPEPEGLIPVTAKPNYYYFLEAVPNKPGAYMFYT